jgi:NAD(P)-dependent dehydrogenase (short-subunit alcohol dehydrogenase family)
VTDLAKKTILLTGASKGIGAATARILGEAGAYLIAHYGSDRAGAEAATAAIPAERKLLLQADLGKSAEVDQLWREAEAWRGSIDVLVNNAATMAWTGGVDDDDETWDSVWAETMQVNVMGPVRLMRNALRHFRPRKQGILITISSWAAQRGSTNPRTVAYAASKAAVKAATQTFARGYAKEGILAYMVAPGVVRTRLSESFAATQPGGEAAVSAGLTMGEWVPPEDIGHLVVFLATGKSSQLTGATIEVTAVWTSCFSSSFRV